MHDLFHVLGLSRNAPLNEVRRACARRTAGTHPDFRPALDLSSTRFVPDEARAVPPRDAAVDFVDVAGLVARIQSEFFSTPS